MSTKIDRPKIKLVGQNGNVFNILGICRQASKKANWSELDWKEFQDQALAAGTYDSVLQLVLKHFEVE